MRGAKGGGYWAREKLLDYRDNDVPRSYWCISLYCVTETVIFLVAISKIYSWRKKKKERKKIIEKTIVVFFDNQNGESYITNKICISSNEIFERNLESYWGSCFYWISIKLLRNRDKNNFRLLGNQTQSGGKVGNFIVPRVNEILPTLKKLITFHWSLKIVEVCEKK